MQLCQQTPLVQQPHPSMPLPFLRAHRYSASLQCSLQRPALQGRGSGHYLPARSPSTGMSRHQADEVIKGEIHFSAPHTPSSRECTWTGTLHCNLGMGTESCTPLGCLACKCKTTSSEAVGCCKALRLSHFGLPKNIQPLPASSSAFHVPLR